MELIARGGFMMIPLLLLGLVALTVMLERAFVWTAHLRTPVGVLDEAVSAIGTADAGATLIARLETARTPVEDVLAVGLVRRASGGDLSAVEASMRTRAETWVPVLEKRLELLDTVITAAPLMGLLGTITGMMSAFRSLANPAGGPAGESHGGPILSGVTSGDAQAVTAGVGEALIATATGLVIALVCLFAYNYFRHRSRLAIFEMELAGGRLLEALRSKS